MGYTKEIVGQDIVLRILCEKFIQDYLAVFSVTVRSMLRVSTLDQEKKYLEEKIQQNNTPFFYCIFERQSNTLIGALEIRQVLESRGQLYCWLNEKFWGFGYFQQAMYSAADAYFNTHDVSFFNAYVDVSNKRSYRALKKCGFADFSFMHGAYEKQYVLILRKK